MLTTFPPLASVMPPSHVSSSSNVTATKASSRDFPLGSRIFVGNLPYSAGEASLLKLFSKFGQIAEVKLAKHQGMRRSKGYAFIQYTSQEDAVLALELTDQTRFGGRTIYAEIAKPLKNGFCDYPISLGPPEQLPNTVTSVVKDGLDGEDLPTSDP